MTKVEVIGRIRKFGEFSIGEVEAIASAYLNNNDCGLEAVIDLAIGWGVSAREAVKRIVEG